MSKSVPDLEQALARTSRGRARRPVEPHEDRPPRVMIAIHVDPEVRDQLREIAYEQKVPLRGLVCAGLNERPAADVRRCRGRSAAVARSTACRSGGGLVVLVRGCWLGNVRQSER